MKKIVSFIKSIIRRVTDYKVVRKSELLVAYNMYDELRRAAYEDSGLIMYFTERRHLTPAEEQILNERVDHLYYTAKRAVCIEAVIWADMESP